MMTVVTIAYTYLALVTCQVLDSPCIFVFHHIEGSIGLQMYNYLMCH